MQQTIVRHNFLIINIIWASFTVSCTQDVIVTLQTTINVTSHILLSNMCCLCRVHIIRFFIHTLCLQNSIDILSRVLRADDKLLISLVIYSLALYKQ